MTTWNPRQYAQQSLAQKAWAADLIAKLGLNGGERILDLGCGDGEITARIAECVPAGSVLGVDSSEEMIGHAREHYPASEYPNLAFAVENAADLHFDEEFDVVFSNAALHWVLDHAPVLAGIRRALKPRGLALLQMGGKGNGEELFAIAADLRREDPWARHFEGFAFPWGFYDAEEYRPWVIAAGLQPVRVEIIPKDAAQDGAEGVKGWMRTTWMPYLAYLPEDMRNEFLDEIVRRHMVNCPPDGEGKVHVRMVRLEVEARRT
jgi:trans-aconitate 2-methyltransferase